MRHSDGLRAALASQRDPNFKNTVLLLHGDGTNGAQNNTFVDGSTNNFTITRNGNTTQGSFSPYGDNWSNYFDGTSDYLQIARTTSLLPGASTDFSVEAWVYLTAYNAQNSFICGYYNRTVNSDWEFQIRSTGVLFFYFATGGIEVNSGANVVPLNQWTHVAVCRSGTGSGNVKIYIDGVERGSGTTNNSTSAGTALNFTVGGDTGGDGNMFTGYISNLRVLNGSAAYAAAFTPSTTPLTAITNTSLLTCQSNRFRDNSTNAFAITRNGDVSVQRFSPFAPSAAYSTSAIGGSGYFDGTGDTLTTNATTAFDFANNNFTIEAWVYTTSFATGQGICANQDNGGVSTLDGWVFALNTDASISFQDWTNTTTVLNLTSSANVIRLNNWHHVVVEKRGTGTNQIQVFVDGVAVATGTRNANIPASTSNQPLTIGNWRYSPDTNREFTGYIADLRIVNSAVYNGTVTVPTAPLTAVTNTSLLCNFTNAGIFDNAMMNDLETVGNAQISTTQKKYGTGALYFDGTGDYLKLPQSPSFQWGTGDFTIECWAYFSTLSGVLNILDQRTAQPQIAITLYSTSNSIRVFVNNADRITSGTISAATWIHVAVCRSGTSTRLFIDGTQAGSTYTDSNNYATQALVIGCPFTAGGDFFNGYIDDLRITKGVARYTSNFTPPLASFKDF